MGFSTTIFFISIKISLPAPRDLYLTNPIPLVGPGCFIQLKCRFLSSPYPPTVRASTTIISSLSLLIISRLRIINFIHRTMTILCQEAAFGQRWFGNPIWHSTMALWYHAACFLCRFLLFNALWHFCTMAPPALLVSMPFSKVIWHLNLSYTVHERKNQTKVVTPFQQSFLFPLADLSRTC